jgi:AraC-like DNA-binding protein
MSLLLRAGDVPAPSRMDYWQHLVEDTLGPIEVVRPPAGLDGRDQLLVDVAGAVRVAELTAGQPGGAIRTAGHVRRADLELCKVDVLASGHGVVAQDGREAVLGPGDLTLVDLSRPARWRMSPMRMVAVVFPRALLPLRPDELARLTAVRFPGDEGTGALASSLARQLVRRLEGLPAADGARLGTAVLDLLTVAVAGRLDRAGQVPSEAHQRALLQRILAFIDARLGDPGLSPAMIAAAHHVSLRYLYTLFEPQRDSVAGWIRRRRLERCRRDLLDPRLAGRPVSAIAARWGLVNAAHFSRAFRAAYGQAPVEYRAMANPADRP